MYSVKIIVQKMIRKVHNLGQSGELASPTLHRTGRYILKSAIVYRPDVMIGGKPTSRRSGSLILKYSGLDR